MTIEARWNRPVRVKWINELVDADGNYLPHLLAVDPTLHWANPPGGNTGRDSRPLFDSTPGPYTGPVPIVTHVHGALGVGDESDGYARPGTCRRPGTSRPATRPRNVVRLLRRQGFDALRRRLGSDYATFQYPNSNRASTIWYHDHALGMTRLNVTVRPATSSAAARMTSSSTLVTAAWPSRGPAPKANDKFPSNKTYYEVPIAIQDRVQRRRVTRTPARISTALSGRTSRRAGWRASRRGNPELRHHGQRQHLAVPGRRTATLPVPLPQRLSVASSSSISTRFPVSRSGRSATRAASWLRP